MGNAGLSQRSARRRSSAMFALACLPVAAAAMLGALATAPNISGWYAGLAKPPLTPPNGVFGPIWTVLYGMMAYAAWRVLALPSTTPGRGRASTWFFIQLALNAAWPWTFFAARNPALGGLTILALLAAILVAIRHVWRLDRAAGLMLLPYAAWVGYATYLNLGIWRLNG